MTSIRISSNKLPAEVFCPSSKSHSNRALAVAAILPGEISLENVARCDDTDYMVKGLKVLGLDVVWEGTRVLVKNSISELQGPIGKIYLGEGGTTIRFFMALAATMALPITIEVHPDFLKRPIEEYIDLLNSLGAKVSLAGSTIKIQGPLKKGQRVDVDCSKTTQFASALELISSELDLEVRPINLSASRSYFEMTKKVVEEVKGSGCYKVPVDFSSFGYFAVWACLNGAVTVRNATFVDSSQADSKVLDIVSDLGGDWSLDEKGLTVYPAKDFRSVAVDGSQCIDLVPSLMFLMSYSGSKQVIKNIKNLRYKESDRLSEMFKIMEVFGVRFDYDAKSDILSIQGRRPDHDYRRIEVARDHRMVMVAAMFLKANGGGEVAPAQAVSKSFPNFFSIF